MSGAEDKVHKLRCPYQEQQCTQEEGEDANEEAGKDEYERAEYKVYEGVYCAQSAYYSPFASAFYPLCKGDEGKESCQQGESCNYSYNKLRKLLRPYKQG